MGVTSCSSVIVINLFPFLNTCLGLCVLPCQPDGAAGIEPPSSPSSKLWDATSTRFIILVSVPGEVIIYKCVFNQTWCWTSFHYDYKWQSRIWMHLQGWRECCWTNWWLTCNRRPVPPAPGKLIVTSPDKWVYGWTKKLFFFISTSMFCMRVPLGKSRLHDFFLKIIEP